MSEEVKIATLTDNVNDQQSLVGGNYPWSAPSDLEKETNKIMKPEISTAISEVLSKINRGPIHLESQNPHPYFKPTLKTLYAKRANQVMIEASVIIPHHLIDSISEEVVSNLKEKSHTFETPINVMYEETDRTGTVKTTKSGVVEQYRFTELNANNGSISATLEGVINWNEK